MPKARPIPSVDIQAYSHPGELYIIPYHSAIRVHVNTSTATLSEAETLTVIISMLKASKQVWGDEFLEKVAQLRAL